MQTSIRPAQLEDIEAIQTLAERVYAAHYSTQAALERFLGRVYSPGSLMRSIRSEAAIFWVAEGAEGAIVGLCHHGSPLLEECEDRKEIHRLYADPATDVSSIQRDLLLAMVDYYVQGGTVRRLFVYISAEDGAQQAFYRDMGFQHDANQDRENQQYWVRAL